MTAFVRPVLDLGSRALLRRGLATLLLAGGLLGGCQLEPADEPALEQSPDLLTQIRDRGRLVVATRSGVTTYLADETGARGYEHDLADALAAELGVELEVLVLDSIEAVLAAVTEGQADLAAAGLTITEERARRVRFSRPYLHASELVVYRAGQTRPRQVDDLAGGRLAVVADSSHAETLRNWQQRLPHLSWAEAQLGHSLELLERVEQGDLDFTVVDSNVFRKSQGLFPTLRVGFEMTEPRPMAWALPAHARAHGLVTWVDRFLDNADQRGLLARLEERYYGHSPEINPRGLFTFSRNAEQRLPRYETLIRRVAAEEDLDWHLLAAISYQESHWNPRAVSPTGVRGMMMLTRPTAAEMGVSNRIDAEQSLRGGARYLKKILRRLPERIPEPDRTWLALAAYNVGFGHLEDARILTQQQGGDPDRWADVARHLPLLRQKEWYAQTRYGYARGDEPVTYVRNIRRYYNILALSEAAQSLPQLASLPVEQVPAASVDADRTLL
jgi:membrane-bound lytic murein transglycosylase F